MENKKVKTDISNNKRVLSSAMPTMRVGQRVQVGKPVAPARPVYPNKPITVTPPTNQDERPPKIETVKNNDSKKKRGIFFGALIFLIAIIVVVVVLLMTNNSNNDNIASDDESTPVVSSTEEEERITKETLDKYTEITVEGYREVDDNPVANAAVIVSVKNISDETVSLAIVIAAMDENETVLDTSSIYAEGIEPEQTHTFETFVYSTLTPEQLKSATYKAYKASTYEAPTASSDETTETAEETLPIVDIQE